MADEASEGTYVHLVFGDSTANLLRETLRLRACWQLRDQGKRSNEVVLTKNVSVRRLRGDVPFGSEKRQRVRCKAKLTNVRERLMREGDMR